MNSAPKPLRAVAAIRVSSTRQGVDGDSPEAQREQIEQFASHRNIRIKKTFTFLESAAKEKQPMQAAIDYCKNPAHHIDVLIVKSIDRFTRGGSYQYSLLKMQLDQCGVRLIDIHGIIGMQRINTLEHLDVSYPWSVFDPTKNSEIIEAERAHGEKREILTRMVGAEIRYARLGYWVRRPPYGYATEAMNTRHGKRQLLAPHPTEAPYIVRLFELRARGTLRDTDIVDELNRLGFRTRARLVRSKRDPTKIIGEIGGEEMTIKQLQRMVRNPIYAAVNNEKWLNGTPIRCMFTGLVTIEQFNLANHGKIKIIDDGLSIRIIKRHRASSNLPVKSPESSKFPYRRVIICSTCRLPLFGSSSTGKLGKRYPAYHCSRNASHYFRMPKAQFDAVVHSFVQKVRVRPAYTEAIAATIDKEFAARLQGLRVDQQISAANINELEIQARLVVGNMKYLRSEIAVTYAEEDLHRIDKQLSAAKVEHDKLTAQIMKASGTVPITQVQRILQNIAGIIASPDNPDTQITLFSLLFNEPPTYKEVLAATEGKRPSTLNDIFELTTADA